jgi:hypothetical protein
MALCTDNIIRGNAAQEKGSSSRAGEASGWIAPALSLVLALGCVSCADSAPGGSDTRVAADGKAADAKGSDTRVATDGKATDGKVNDTRSTADGGVGDGGSNLDLRANDGALCGGGAVRVHSSSQNTLYGGLQQAYGGASSGDTIQAASGTFNENLICDASTSITFSGGFDCSFSTNTGVTTIRGSVTIAGQATVTFDNFAIE